MSEYEEDTMEDEILEPGDNPEDDFVLSRGAVDLSDPELCGFDTSTIKAETYDQNDVFKFLSEIIRAEYRQDIVKHIKTLPLTLQYKEVLLATVTELLSITKVLANNDKKILTKYSYIDPMPSKLLDAELRLLMTQTCAWARDLEVMNAWITESNVLAQHRDYISRTTGGRERERNNLFIKQQMISSSEDITQQQPIEKKRGPGIRGFLSRLG
jgi:hypothetical protein